MAELSTSARDITAALKDMLEGYEPSTTEEQVGRVVETADGIARVVGLPGTMANELLEAKIDALEEGRPLARRRSRR